MTAGRRRNKPKLWLFSPRTPLRSSLFGHLPHHAHCFLCVVCVCVCVCVCVWCVFFKRCPATTRWFTVKGVCNRISSRRRLLICRLPSFIYWLIDWFIYLFTYLFIDSAIANQLQWIGILSWKQLDWSLSLYSYVCHVCIATFLHDDINVDCRM